MFFGSFLHVLAKSAIGGDSTTNGNSFRSKSRAQAMARFVKPRATVAWKLAARSATGSGSTPSALSFSTRRSTAVFNPLKLES